MDFQERLRQRVAEAEEGNGQNRKQVDFETLLKESDILSVHAPLNEKTQGLMDMKAFEQMKKTAGLLRIGINISHGNFLHHIGQQLVRFELV